MTKKRRIYQISIALLLCLMQTAGIAMYGQSRPRAAAKRIQRQACRRTASSADAGRQPEPDYGRSAASPGRCPGRQHCHCRQHCRREQEKAAGNDFRSRPERIGSAGRQPQKGNRSENMGTNPTKATWLALVIPGGGQIYNRKYWKLPIFYGGFAGCAYALTWNSKMYKDYSTAYKDAMNGNMQSSSITDLLPPGYKISETQLKELLRSARTPIRRISRFKYLRLHRSIPAVRYRCLCGCRTVQLRHHPPTSAGK